MKGVFARLRAQTTPVTRTLAIIVLLTMACGISFAYGEDNADQQQVLDKYLTANRGQAPAMRGVTMEVDIDAQVPKLKKQGKLHALRNISKLGKITYNILGFSGDKSVKTEVIARYLTAETQEQTGPDASITPENYKFKYKGLENKDDKDVYVFHVTPRRKQERLFKGEIWIDAQSYLLVRESGRFVKTPSFIMKKVDFVLTFNVENGIAVPQRMESRADTHIFGPVELNINYTHFSRESDEVATSQNSNQ